MKTFSQVRQASSLGLRVGLSGRLLRDGTSCIRYVNLHTDRAIEQVACCSCNVLYFNIIGAAIDSYLPSHRVILVADIAVLVFDLGVGIPCLLLGTSYNVNVHHSQLLRTD